MLCSNKKSLKIKNSWGFSLTLFYTKSGYEMNSLEENYRHSLLSAEKQFKYLSTISQWKLEENNVYTTTVNKLKTIKVVKDLNSNETNLDHVYASLVTVGIRTLCNMLRFIIFFKLLTKYI